MSDLLLSGAIRRAFRDDLAAMALEVEGRAVRFLGGLPDDWMIPEADLPAMFLATSGEREIDIGLGHSTRALDLDLICAAGGSDPQDGLDRMQLEAERVAANFLAGAGSGLAQSLRFTGSEIARRNGALILGVRVLRFSAEYGVTPDDPSL